jgi:hypothetical protein
MSAPEIAYRLACAPPAAIGGTLAKLVALVIANRWAQADGRFIVRQAAIIDATGLSKASVVRAVAALRSVKVYADLPAEEGRLVVDHLPGRLLPATERSPTASAPARAAGSAGAGSALPATARTSRDTSPPGGDGCSQSPNGIGQRPEGRSEPEAVSPLLDVSVSSSPLDAHEVEGEDARAGEAPAAAEGPAATAPAHPVEPFTDLDERRLRWLAARGVLMVNPATGEDLRREWLRITAGVGAELVKAILDVRVGDYPSDFRKAAEPFATQVDDARRAAAARAAAAAAALAADQARQVQDEEQARQRGPFLEQGAALLAEIVAADSRRLHLAERQAGWYRALSGLRLGVSAGAVEADSLAAARDLWGRVRNAELPPAPTPPPAPLAAEPPAQRSFTEPASADSEPAAP